MAAETNKICKPNAFAGKSRGTNVRNGVWLIGYRPRTTMNFQPQVCSENVSANGTQNWVCANLREHHTPHQTSNEEKKKWIPHVPALKLLNQNNRKRFFFYLFISVRLSTRELVFFSRIHLLWFCLSYSSPTKSGLSLEHWLNWLDDFIFFFFFFRIW